MIFYRLLHFYIKNKIELREASCLFLMNQTWKYTKRQVCSSPSHHVFCSLFYLGCLSVEKKEIKKSVNEIEYGLS